MRSHLFAAVAALTLAAPAPGAAQDRPSRPRLPAAADTNDWEAYYDQGVVHLRARRQVDAEANFLWASRLDPTRAEPFYARWVAYWARDPKRYMRYEDGEAEVTQSPEVLRTDSIRDVAFDRNPLVYQGLQVLILDQLGGGIRWKEDPGTLGWLSYGTMQFDRAAEQFQRAVSRGGHWAHYSRALVFTAQERYDSATVEMQKLLAALRAQDAKSVQYAYMSKAFVEYTIGRLALARNDAAAARDAFGRALAEDLAYVPAHSWMGTVALGAGDVETAVREHAQAAELRPNDGMLRWQHGRALGAAGRDEEAIVEFRRAIELEPHWADPWFSLALALDREALPNDAIAAYRTWLARAPRSSPNLARARARLEALTASTTR